MQATPTQGQPVTIVQVVEKPSQEISVADILLGSVGFVGLALVTAAVVGLLAGAVLILLKRLRPSNHLNGQDAEETALRLNS
jgi:hypothetical protein